MYGNSVYEVKCRKRKEINNCFSIDSVLFLFCQASVDQGNFLLEFKGYFLNL